MKIFHLFLFLLTSVSAMGQFQTEWGKCPMSDFSMEKYPLDTTAEAVILHDLGKLYASVDPWEYSLVHHRRIKILTDAGLDYANISIPYYKENSRDFIRNIKAQILQPNGKSIELKKSDFYKEDINNYWAAMNFTFPNVQPGSIIEYEYELISQDIVNLKDWYFQQNIPVRYSKIVSTINERLVYIYLFQGADYLIKQPDGSFRLGEHTIAKIDAPTYEMQNIPAFKEEAYMTTEEDYKNKIRFQLDKILYVDGSRGGNNYYAKPVLSSWDEIRDKLWMNESLGEQFAKKNNFKNAFETILPMTLGAKSQKEKANIAYTYLAENIEWSGINSGIYTIEKLDKVFDKRRATKSEMNLLLLGILRELEIEAYPILTSTRNHGKLLPQHPILDQFNYVLVRANLDGEWLLLDVGEPLRPMGYPSVNALNYMGWQFDRTKHEWIEIEIPISKESLVVRCAIEGNKLVGRFTSKSKGYYALKERMAFRDEKTGAYWLKRLNVNGVNMAMDSFIVNNYQDVAEDFTSEFKFELNDWVTENEHFLYISPMIYTALKDNPFKSEKRYYPVDYDYRFSQQYVFQLEIPSGYEIEQLPENTTVQLPNKGGSFRLSMSILNNKVQFVAILDVKRLQYQPSDYEALKLCYDTMLATYDEMIVLKKKA
ncbi:MAG: DUF3857 domain-containing protein [Saprospiraceae bacterium]|nr:DUF3857 domain-containing protein [Saprospiraceae bacterium]